ncbi:MAG: hypothetical protein HY671_11135 [Chloroflexi bacterium]|nr:hypothetical protein [Chloroflexota bacterium]
MDAATVDALNELLAAERAGVETLGLLRREYRDLEHKFAQIEKDEARSCTGLARSIRALGGVMSQERGDFAAKVQGQTSLKNKLQLLARGQGWVVKRLDVLLNKELPAEVTDFLQNMKVVHQRNIEWCNERSKTLSAAQ